MPCTPFLRPGPVPGRPVGQTMITIGAPQWRRLEAERRDDFITQLSRDFIERFAKPGEVYTLEAVKAEMETVIARGEAWGMRSSEVLYQHALVSRIIGHDYADAVPETGSVVRSTTLDDATKARWLTQWLASIRQRVAAGAA